MPKSTAKKHPVSMKLTWQILAGLVTGIGAGLLLRHLLQSDFTDAYIVDGMLDVVGKWFIVAMKMLVVPIVFVSLICGVTNLKNLRQLGRMGAKTFVLYIMTTAVAISLALIIANLIGVGHGDYDMSVAQHIVPKAPSLKETLIDLVPSNPFSAFVDGKMIQVIIFAILLGIAIIKSGKSGEKIAEFFNDFNVVIMHMITMVIKLAPYGVFALMAGLFAKSSFGLIKEMGLYFVTVLLVLFVHWAVTYSLLIKVFARLNPLVFFKKMLSLMLFAFSTSSSNATLPVTLGTVEKKLGVKNTVASFVIPLGATINMDGTAIMQGVATVFIANVYHVDISIAGYLMVIAMATLASIGTAGVPGVGLITLMMVLRQVGIPAEGIALIIGVDRLLDMVRTAVNVSGDAAVAVVVGRTEGEFNERVFKNTDIR
tara:strand:+ start:19682 stop:20962 length:1281 start_codon:yes stop_codon:yes gene_type:complete